MIRKIVILCVASLILSCTLDIRREHDGPYAPVTYPDSETSEYVYVGISYYDDPLCYEDPYWHAPDWCDWYDDNTTCCVWYVDGWYEEWCQWEDDICWDYNGSF